MRIDAQILCSLVKHQNASLVIKFLFLVLRSWRLSPSISLFEIRVVQLRRCIFFLTIEEPQINCRWILLIYLVIVSGRVIACITWIGMLLKVAFARIVQPTIFKKFVCHPSSFLWRLVKINWQSLLVDFLSKMITPIYLSKYFPILRFRLLVVVMVIRFSGQFSEEKIKTWFWEIYSLTRVKRIDLGFSIWYYNFSQ